MLGQASPIPRAILGLAGPGAGPSSQGILGYTGPGAGPRLRAILVLVLVPVPGLYWVWLVPVLSLYWSRLVPVVVTVPRAILVMVLVPVPRLYWSQYQPVPLPYPSQRRGMAGVSQQGLLLGTSSPSIPVIPPPPPIPPPGRMRPAMESMALFPPHPRHTGMRDLQDRGSGTCVCVSPINIVQSSLNWGGVGGVLPRGGAPCRPSGASRPGAGGVGDKGDPPQLGGGNGVPQVCAGEEGGVWGGLRHPQGTGQPLCSARGTYGCPPGWQWGGGR